MTARLSQEPDPSLAHRNSFLPSADKEKFIKINPTIDGGKAACSIFEAPVSPVALAW